jgi:F0F1-type ATP synthase delta subunit
MKYPAHIYAKALAEVIVAAEGAGEKEQDAIVARLVAFVRKNGDEAHLRKIVEEAARFVRGKSGVRKVMMETARPLGAQQKKKLAAFIKTGDVVVEKINPELVAGVKIIVNDELQFDGSLKGKLDKLFGN